MFLSFSVQRLGIVFIDGQREVPIVWFSDHFLLEDCGVDRVKG